MNFQDYQQESLKTSQVPIQKGTEFLVKIVPLLGLAGEAGELLSEYKKLLRDGASHKLSKQRIQEELGDILWYVSNVASAFDIKLEEVAEANLKKVQNRWQTLIINEEGYNFDKNFPENEKLPRRFEITIKNKNLDENIYVQSFFDGKQIGNNLTDNSHNPDGYRFHDVFHFAHAAVLGWSPVTRSILKRKRKSDRKIDEVEDGGRAIAIEEGVIALVFSYAESHNFLMGITELDYNLLKTIIYLTSRLEVSVCSMGDWEKAIFLGYKVWRQVNENNGGKIIADLDNQNLTFEPI